ncbi:PH domain-containing protein [Kocuria atrinae]|uniref:PH domain-containing protein n=1 Tax=Kocuria atrinae TaxID=592377 RepID=UPI0021D44BF0|nr:PH domain-containing protein [Kocuria atrinae]
MQGIDIERKFLPRIFGLASLKFDVADGGSSALELSYLRRDKARELRHQLLGAVREASRSARQRRMTPGAMLETFTGTTTPPTRRPRPPHRWPRVTGRHRGTTLRRPRNSGRYSPGTVRAPDSQQTRNVPAKFERPSGWVCSRTRTIRINSAACSRFRPVGCC